MPRHYVRAYSSPIDILLHEEMFIWDGGVKETRAKKGKKNREVNSASENVVKLKERTRIPRGTSKLMFK